MDEIKQDTTEPVWTPDIRNLEVHEDIILRIPNFTTIERFLIVGGGKADHIYDGMMECAIPKGSKLVLNIMNELKNKASQNLRAVRAIAGLTDYLDCTTIYLIKKIQRVSDLIFEFALYCQCAKQC